VTRAGARAYARGDSLTIRCLGSTGLIQATLNVVQWYTATHLLETPLRPIGAVLSALNFEAPLLGVRLDLPSPEGMPPPATALALAVGLLTIYGYVEDSSAHHWIFIGDLTTSGRIASPGFSIPVPREVTGGLLTGRDVEITTPESRSLKIERFETLRELVESLSPPPPVVPRPTRAAVDAAPGSPVIDTPGQPGAGHVPLVDAQSTSTPWGYNPTAKTDYKRRLDPPPVLVLVHYSRGDLSAPQGDCVVCERWVGVGGSHRRGVGRR
jgi:hypothetical protein